MSNNLTSSQEILNPTLHVNNNSMKQYIKKPIEITAVLLTDDNIRQVKEWANGIQPADKQVFICGVPYGLIIPTKEGEMLCSIGDYLIKEPFPTDDRMFYPCKPDMFELTYQEKI